MENQEVVKVPGKGLAIASLVLGILACAGGWIIPMWGGIAGIISGIVGLVFAIIAKKKAAEAGQKLGMATAGLVLSIIGLALAVIAFLACGLCLCAVKEVATDPAVSSALSSALNELK